MRGQDSTAGRLLTRLFLRRLMDNDVLSPNADRHESLAVLYASVASAGVFVTFFLSTNYLVAFVQLPGLTALSALSDHFLFMSASIAVCALAALMVWDALALEPRDVAVLGPLPITAGTFTRAKLAAAFVFGAVVSVALNAVPSLLYPLLLTLNMRGMTGGGVLRLVAGHATSVVMAGVFGFFGVLATRGVVRLIVGERGFLRVSSTVQSVLVVGMVTALLLAPTINATRVREGISGKVPFRLLALPALWFLGVNDTLAGHIVAETPVVLPSRYAFLPYPKEAEEANRATYRALLPRFAVFAQTAWQAVMLVAGLGLTTFLWNHRRLPERDVAVKNRSRIRRRVQRIAERLTHRNPESQAGFFFTWQTMTRSVPHRTVIAVAVAAGVTHLLVTLASTGMPTVGIRFMPLGWFAIAILALTSLMAAFRYAVTVPAEVGSNWAIRMAWRGDDRDYLAGVKRAALVGLATVPLFVLLPLHIVLFGVAIALVHSLYGVMVAVAVLDGLFLTYRKFPFACTYVPLENPKLLWPAGLSAVLLLTYGYADVERWAVRAPLRMVGLGVILVVIVIVLKLVDRAWRREPRTVNFDERPALATQRLGLFESMAIHD